MQQTCCNLLQPELALKDQTVNIGTLKYSGRTPHLLIIRICHRCFISAMFGLVNNNVANFKLELGGNPAQMHGMKDLKLNLYCILYSVYINNYIIFICLK